MEEYISRTKTLKAIKGSISEVFNIASNAGRMHQKITEIVESVPAADVAPVVRCRECKHFNLQTHECENELLSTDHEGGASYSLNFYDDDFCSYGERSIKK